MFNEKNTARLMDIANAGCHLGHVLEARSIYNAILEAKKDFAPAKLGLAYSFLVVDDFKEAARLAQEVLDKNANDEDAIGLLGFCQFLADDKDLAKATLQPLSESGNSNAKQLAQDILSAI